MIKNIIFNLRILILILICTSCGFYKSKSSPISPESYAILNQPIGYKQVNQYVFSPSCVSCHNSSSSAGKVKLDTYTSVYIHLAGIKQESITTHHMPIAPVPALNAFQVELLSQWINNGAPEQTPEPGATPTPSASPTPTPESPVILDIRADFELYVKPLVQKACMDCHNANAVPEGIGHLPIVRGIELKHIREGTKVLDFSKPFPYWSAISSEPAYYLTSIKGVIVNKTMPLKSFKIFHELDGKLLDRAENQVILNWIKNSMELLNSVSTYPPTAQNYLETHCMGCHNDSVQSGGFKLGSKGSTSNGIPFLTPFEPENSAIYLVLLNDSAARKGLTQMPEGDSASTDEKKMIYDWIKAGATK